MHTATPRLTKLDEIVLGVLAAKRAPDTAPSDDDKLVVIELVHSEDVDEAAVTGRFLKMPYEHLEIQPLREALGKRRGRPTTFVHTIPSTRGLDTPWFHTNEDELVKIEDPLDTERRQSWWWLGISLAVGAAAVAALYVLTAA